MYFQTGNIILDWFAPLSSNLQMLISLFQLEIYGEVLYNVDWSKRAFRYLEWKLLDKVQK